MQEFYNDVMVWVQMAAMASSWEEPMNTAMSMYGLSEHEVIHEEQLESKVIGFLICVLECSAGFVSGVSDQY